MQNWWRKTITLFVGGGQLLSRVRLCDPVDCTHQGSLSFTISQSLLRFMSIESVMLSNQLILCHPLLLLPSIFPNIRVFSSELTLHIRWLKYWSFSSNPSSEYSGLISFNNGGFDLFAVQGTLKSLLEHHNLKASILQPPDVKSWLIGKDPDVGTDRRQKEKGVAENELVR